jgi:glycosyltransferase involved in cell wall biosynthesis
MRIAIVAPPWVPVPPPGYGGTERVIDELARGLAAAGHDVLLWATGDSTCDVPTRWVLPNAVGTAGAAPATELHHVICAYEDIMAWGADVVHDHTLCGPVYAATLPVPIVTTNHGPFDSELGPLYRAISEHTDVVAISHHQASLATSDTRIAAVIHHGLDTTTVPLGRGDGGYAAFLGRMCPDKGVDAAIRIARSAGMRLKIAAKLAEPAEREYFRACVEPLLGRDTEYVGEVGGDEKWELLGGATCLLNPLRWSEPFGMVMIEALATGTPVVATANGSVPEIVTDGVNGFIGVSERQLAHAVRRVELLDRSTCRRIVADEFSITRMVREHVRLFEAAAFRERRTPAAAVTAQPAVLA